MAHEHPSQAPRHHIRQRGSSDHPLDRSNRHHVDHPRHGCCSGLHGQTRRSDRCHEEHSRHDVRNHGHGRRNGRMSRDSCSRHVAHHHSHHHRDDHRNDQSGHVVARAGTRPLLILSVGSRRGVSTPLTSLWRTKIFPGRWSSRTSSPSFFNAKSSTLEDFTLQSLLCGVCLLSCDHFDESKATRLFGVRVKHYGTLLHVAVFLKKSRNL